MVTDRFENTLEQVAESFPKENPVNSAAIEPMLRILRKEFKDTKRKILSLNNTVKITAQACFNNEYQYLSSTLFSQWTNKFFCVLMTKQAAIQ